MLPGVQRVWPCGKHPLLVPWCPYVCEDSTGQGDRSTTQPQMVQTDRGLSSPGASDPREGRLGSVSLAGSEAEVQVPAQLPSEQKSGLCWGPVAVA